MSQPVRTTEHPLRGANLRNYIKALGVEKFTNDIAMPLLLGGTVSYTHLTLPTKA